MGGIGGAIGAVTETTGEGVFLPSEDQLITNATWTYSSNGTMSMDAGGVSMEGSSAMTAVDTVVGLDGQTDVQATTLGGIMTVLNEQTVEINFGGVATPATETRSTLMFARGIGLVSSASAGDGIYSSSTLVSYSIP